MTVFKEDMQFLKKILNLNDVVIAVIVKEMTTAFDATPQMSRAFGEDFRHQMSFLR